MDIATEFQLTIPGKLEHDDKILLIDEHQDMRMILAHQLQKLNFNNVSQARDGMEALASLKKQKYAAIICDLDMKQMTGLDLLAEIREDVNIDRPPFCLTMSNVSKEKLMLAVETGVDEILVKPFTLGDIVPKLRKCFSTFHNHKNPEKVYELAKEKLREEDYDAANAIYKKLSQSAEGAARPLVGMAKVSFQKKQYDEALKNLEEAEAKNNKFVHLFSLRGDVYVSLDKVDQAVESYQKAIDLSPLNPARYLKAGDILLKKEKYQECVDILRIAVSKKVQFKELHHLISQSYYHLKDYQNSAKFIRRALDKEPENIEYLNQMALSLKESGEIEEAKKFYNKVIKLDPENKRALFNKAIMLAQTNKLDEAIKILERLTLKFPDFEKGKVKLKELQDQVKESAEQK